MREKAIHYYWRCSKSGAILHTLITIPLIAIILLILVNAFTINFQITQLEQIIHAFNLQAVFFVLDNSQYWGSLLHSICIGFLITACALIAVFATQASYCLHILSNTDEQNAIFKKVLFVLTLFILIQTHLHLHFGLGFLFGKTGLLARIAYLFGWEIAFWSWPFAGSYFVLMFLKEYFFLLLLSMSITSSIATKKIIKTSHALGYTQSQAIITGIIPLLYTRLRLPLLIIFIYSVSNVETALLSQPNTNQLIGVLLWKWATEIDIAYHNYAAAGTVFLLITLGLCIWLYTHIEPFGKKYIFRIFVNGKRHNKTLHPRIGLSIWGVSTLISCLALFAMCLWSISVSWRYPDVLPSILSSKFILQKGLLDTLQTTVLLSLSATCISLICAVAYLQLRKNTNTWHYWIIYTPILLPQITIVPNLYSLMIATDTSGNFMAVLFSHFLFVFPYQILLLDKAFSQFDNRYIRCALSLGKHPLLCWLQIQLPLLLPSILFALFVGLLLSLHLFLPTFFIGEGRVNTLMQEMVTLGSSMDRRIIGALMLWLLLIPLAVGIAMYILVKKIAYIPISSHQN